MKTLKITLLALLGSVAVSLAGWTTYEAGLAEAKAGNKMMLINFASLDLNPRARAFDAPFRTPEFARYTEGRLVLANVVVSVTAGYAKAQAENVKKAKVIAGQYSVSSIPTVLIVDSNGKRMGQVSAPSDGQVKTLLSSIDAITKLGLIAETPTPAPTATPRRHRE